MNAKPDGDMSSPDRETNSDAARRRFVQSKVDAGWKQHKGWIVQPQDAEMGFYVDSKLGRLAFSPRMVAQLKRDGSADEMFRLNRRDGGQTEEGEKP
jgi:hypothetical protein